MSWYEKPVIQIFEDFKKSLYLKNTNLYLKNTNEYFYKHLSMKTHIN